MLIHFVCLGLLHPANVDLTCDYSLAKEADPNAAVGIYGHTLSGSGVFKLESEFYVFRSKQLDVADQPPINTTGSGYRVQGVYRNGITLTGKSLWNSRLHRAEVGGQGPPWQIIDNYQIFSNGFVNQSNGDVRVIDDFETRCCSPEYLDRGTHIVLYGMRANKPCFVFFPAPGGSSLPPRVTPFKGEHVGSIEGIGATPFGILASRRRGLVCSLVLYDRSGRELKNLASERLREGETSSAFTQVLVTFNGGEEFAWLVGRRLYLGVLRKEGS